MSSWVLSLGPVPMSLELGSTDPYKTNIGVLQDTYTIHHSNNKPSFRNFSTDLLEITENLDINCFYWVNVELFIVLIAFIS